MIQRLCLTAHSRIHSYHPARALIRRSSRFHASHTLNSSGVISSAAAIPSSSSPGAATAPGPGGGELASASCIMIVFVDTPRWKYTRKTMVLESQVNRLRTSQAIMLIVSRSQISLGPWPLQVKYPWTWVPRRPC